MVCVPVIGGDDGTIKLDNLTGLNLPPLVASESSNSKESSVVCSGIVYWV